MYLPSPLRHAYNLWLSFSHYLGLIVSTIILTVLWIVGFGLYAIAWHTIHLFQRKNGADSYWIPVKPDPPEYMQYPF